MRTSNDGHPGHLLPSASFVTSCYHFVFLLEFSFILCSHNFAAGVLALVSAMAESLSVVEPLKTGMLNKKSRNRSGRSFNKSWTNRYLILSSSALAYCAGPDQPPKDSVSINSSTTCETCGDVEKRIFAFVVRTTEPKEELVLEASNEVEMDEWIIAIANAASGVGEVHIKGPIQLDSSADSDDEVEVEPSGE